MPAAGLVTSKVKAYLSALSPKAREMLLRSARHSLERGETGAQHAVVLAAMDEIAAGGGDWLPIDEVDVPQKAAPEAQTAPVVQPTPETQAAPEAPSAPASARPAAAAPKPATPTAPPRPWKERVERAFFAPLQPFLIDVDLTMKQQGRILDAHLAPLWTWIARDVARADVERVLAADPGDPAADATAVARKLRRDLTPRVIEMLRLVEDDQKARQKLAAQIGGDAVLRDLRDVLYVFQREAAFANLLGQWPQTLSAYDIADQSRVVESVRVAVEQLRLAVPFVGAAMLSRTQNAIVPVLAAVHFAGSTDARLVAGSRYAGFVDITLSEIERDVVDACEGARDRRRRARLIDDLRAYHDTMRNLRFAVDVDPVSQWLKRIGACRLRISELIASEIEQAPGLVRRALRVESLAGEFGARFDPAAFEDAEFAVRLLVEARLAADSLAVNELVSRTRKQVEQTLEVVTAKLMSDLKSNAALDRASLTEAIDGAVKLSALVFGEDYAAIVRKSRDNAVKQPTRAAG